MQHPRGLADLVAQAGERALGWWRWNSGRDRDETWSAEERNIIQDTTEDVAETVIRAGDRGEYRRALLTSELRESHLSDDSYSYVGWVETEPTWLAFTAVASFADRLDCFLSSLERDRATASLARDCRENLKLLRVLADWCEDTDRPRAAEEAIHLYNLALSYARHEASPW